MILAAAKKNSLELGTIGGHFKRRSIKTGFCRSNRVALQSKPVLGAGKNTQNQCGGKKN